MQRGGPASQGGDAPDFGVLGVEKRVVVATGRALGRAVMQAG